MSTPEVVETILAHHGVKGMKWGVRRAATASTGSSSKGKGEAKGVTRAEKKLAKRDAKLEKALSSDRRSYELKRQVHNSVAPMVQSRIHQMNAKPEYAKAAAAGKFKNPNDPITQKYVKEYNKMYIDTMNDYLKGYTNPSGTKSVRAELNSEAFNGFSLRLVDKTKAKHADSDIMTIEYIKDENGVITGFKLVKDDLIQSAIDDVLAHHGVKGMKWGVRRDRPSAVTVSDKGKKLKTKGGYGRPAHPDAVRVRTSGQVARKSGYKALSDAELKAYTNRLNLEQNAKRLAYEDSSVGRKFVLSFMRQTGKRTTENLSNEASERIKKGVRRAITAAAVA